VRTFLSIVLAALASCSGAWAQATAQIHGTVQDSSGSAVPGAEVRATQTETGFSRSVNSESDGSYVLTILPLGPYRLEVSKEGFTRAVESGIVLQVNSDPAITVALKLGSLTEQVNVEANAALVDTRNSGVGSVVETQRIVELPLNGRNVTDLTRSPAPLFRTDSATPACSATGPTSPLRVWPRFHSAEGQRIGYTMAPAITTL
jgi:hypothetical protein